MLPTPIDSARAISPDVYSDSTWLIIVCFVSTLVHVYIPLLIISYYTGKILCQWIQFLQYKKRILLTNTGGVMIQ